MLRKSRPLAQSINISRFQTVTYVKNRDGQRRSCSAISLIEIHWLCSLPSKSEGQTRYDSRRKNHSSSLSSLNQPDYTICISSLLDIPQGAVAPVPSKRSHPPEPRFEAIPFAIFSSRNGRREPMRTAGERFARFCCLGRGIGAAAQVGGYRYDAAIRHIRT